MTVSVEPVRHASAAGGLWAGLPTFSVSLIVGAWAFAILACAEGWDELLGHDRLIEPGPGPWAALGPFLVGWQVMVAAMMLPSSLPMLRRFAGLVEGETRRGTLGAAFLSGYVSVFTVFGIAAFAGDGMLHRIVDGWPWLAARPWVIGGSALVLAGGLQLSRLAERCRTVVRVADGPRPGNRVDPRGAIALGADHGRERLKRCWPLMLLSFAVGMTSLIWMAALTLVMLLEGPGTWRRVAGAHAGAGLLVLGTMVLAHPGWLATLVPGAA